MSTIDEVFEYVGKYPGQRPFQIAQAIGVSTDTVISALKRLVQQQRIIKKGNCRSYLYYPQGIKFRDLCKLYDKCHLQGVRAGRAS